MRGLLLLMFALGGHCVAPILNSNANTTVEDSYVVVLKKSLTKASVVSHMERANLILATANAKSFDIAGFRGYNVKTTAQGIEKLAQSDEVSINITSFLYTKLLHESTATKMQATFLTDADSIPRSPTSSLIKPSPSPMTSPVETHRVLLRDDQNESEMYRRMPLGALHAYRTARKARQTMSIVEPPAPLSTSSIQV